MVRYHSKCLCRDLALALRGKGPWFEARYHALSLWSDLIHPFRAFWYGLVNLRHYLPIIWHDRDWDYSCMLELWVKKFDRMAELHLKYGHHLGKEETARQLRVCASLSRRIMADDYTDIPMAAHDAKWGKADFSFTPTGHGTSRMNIDRANVQTEADKKLQSEEFRRICKAGDAQRQADIDYLTALVRKHMLGWWD